MRSALLSGLMLCLALPLGAATPSEIPSRWAEWVVPLPAQRLDELEPEKIGRIRETRRAIGGLLAAAQTSRTELAAAYGRLGALYAAERLYAGAELALANARALDPMDFRWAYYAAHTALEQGEAAQGLTLLSDAATVDPEYPTLPLRRGEALLGLSRLEEARAAFEQVEPVAGLRAAALYGLAQIDLLERQWDTAAERLREVLTLQPDADAAHYPLGRALVGMGHRDDARAYLSRPGNRRPDYQDALVEELRSLQSGARRHFENALEAVKREDYAAAAEAFAAGLEEQPDNARARTSYARALWIAGQRDDVEAQLRLAIEAAPEETLPRFLLAVLRDAAGDADAAIAGYREVLAIDPDHDGALGYLANLSFRLGDYAAAADFFERAIDSGVTQLPLYLHYWGASLYGGVDDALLRDRLVAFDRRFPEPPLFRFLLARLLATSTQPEVADVERAIELATGLQQSQPIPPHTELLALVLAAAGEFERAEALQRGLVEMARMSGAWLQAAELERVADGYRDGRLPEPIWSPKDPMLTPAPIDAGSVMRNYPAGQPY